MSLFNSPRGWIMQLDKVEVESLLKVLGDHPNEDIILIATPTGIGVNTCVKLEDGSEVDITNYESW